MSGEDYLIKISVRNKQKYENNLKSFFYFNISKPDWLDGFSIKKENDKLEWKVKRPQGNSETVNKGSGEQSNPRFKYPVFLEYTDYVFEVPDGKLFIGDEELEPIDSDGKGVYVYNWKDWIGFSTIKIRKGKEEFSFDVFIHPTKMNEELDYSRMIHFIENFMRRLAYHFSSHSHIHLQKEKSFEKDIFLERLLKYKKRLIITLQEIEKNPHKRIVKEERIKKVWRAKGNNPNIGNWLASHRVEYYEYCSRKIPIVVADLEPVISYNTIPNQFLVYFLKYLIRNLDIALRNAKVEAKGRKKSDLIREGEELLAFLKLFSKNEFLMDVPLLKSFNINTLVLSTDRNYYSLYKIYQELRHLLVLSTEQFYDYSIWNLSRLYEVWLYLVIVEGFKRLGLEMKEQDIIKKGWFGFDVNLKRGKESFVRFAHNSSEYIVRYQRGYTPEKNRKPYTPLINLIPDVSIEIKEDGKIKKLIFIEAKYMREEQINRVEEDGETFEIGKTKVPSSGIKAVHAYLDGIKCDVENIQKIGVAVYPLLITDNKFLGKLKRCRGEEGKDWNIDVLGLQPRNWWNEVRDFLKRWVFSDIIEEIKKKNGNEITIEPEMDKKDFVIPNIAVTFADKIDMEEIKEETEEKDSVQGKNASLIITFSDKSEIKKEKRYGLKVDIQDNKFVIKIVKENIEKVFWDIPAGLLKIALAKLMLENANDSKDKELEELAKNLYIYALTEYFGLEQPFSREEIEAAKNHAGNKGVVNDPIISNLFLKKYQERRKLEKKVKLEEILCVIKTKGKENNGEGKKNENKCQVKKQVKKEDGIKVAYIRGYTEKANEEINVIEGKFGKENLINFLSVDGWSLSKAAEHFDIIHIGGHFDTLPGVKNEKIYCVNLFEDYAIYPSKNNERNNEKNNEKNNEEKFITPRDIIETQIIKPETTVVLLLCNSAGFEDNDQTNQCFLWERLTPAHIFLLCGAGRVIGVKGELEEDNVGDICKQIYSTNAQDNT